MMTTQAPRPDLVDSPMLLTIEETRQRLRLSRNSVIAAINRGELITVRIGHRRFVSPADLAKFINQQRDVRGHGA